MSPDSSPLSPADVTVLLAYLLGTTALGLWVGRRSRTVAEYFMPRKFSKPVMIMYAFGTGTASDQAVVVASAPPEVQRARVLERPGMTAEKLEAILAKQMPDEAKRRRADFVVDTSRGFDAARAQVHAILDAVATMPKRRR